MRQSDTYIHKHPGIIFTLLLLLAVPAFFTNLGLLPLFADEPTRANVALEMILSKNFAVPTVGGEYYYNKPPLYNWILAGLYLLTGSYSEFVTRLPAIIPMFLFTITIYYTVAFFLQSKHIALVSAMFFMLNGRMLIYDSMLGHIDIFYSWLTFISFICIFYFYQRQQWFWLFFISYLLTAITFLCKGMPSIVFQGLTVITFLIYTKNFKKIFSWQHILSGISCLLIIAAYFYNYSLYNNNLEGYFSTIWDQSSQRTAARAGFWKTAKHLLLFPIEHIGHLVPASLLMLFCFNKWFIPGIRQNSFLKFVSLIFLANIWIYWLSPETRPRYLLMLYPLLFIIWSHAYFTYRDKLPKLNKLFNIFLLIIAVLITLAVPAVLFAGIKALVPFLVLKVIILLVSCAVLSWLIYRSQAYKLIPFLALLIIIRLGFSWFVLPKRAHHSEGSYYKTASIEMAKKSRNHSFYFYQYHPDVVTIPFHDKLIFYIEHARMSKVKFTQNDSKPGYYLTFDRDLRNPRAVLVNAYNGNLKLFEVK